MTTETAAKRDTQKLQRAIVDGLEDVKAQDIQVFDTEHLSPLFERVIVASGTSNRQTKALAASVVDAVREAGFAKPRVEGQDNGEWIIVDCAQAVVHIMQPAFRTYYHLEELWGEKPVRLKLGSAKPVVVAKAPEPDTKVSARAKAVAAAKKNYAGKAPVRRTTEALAGAAPSAPARASRGSSSKASPAKTTASKTAASKTAAPKVFVAKTFAAQPSAANKAGAARTTAAKKAPAKPSAARPGARPASAKTASARPAAASKPRAAAPAGKSPAAKKPAPRKSPASRS